MRIWTDDECIEVEPNDVGELEAAMRFKAEHIKAKADPELFTAVADMLDELWDVAIRWADVVRCRECKYHKDTSINEYEHCCLIGQTVQYDDFCSYGERKEGADRMDVREKLVELLQVDLSGSDGYEPELIADYLINNGVTVQEWISVRERLPEEKVNCIVHYKHAYCDNDDYWAIGICFYDGEKFQLNSAYKVTHWMPLPEPPKGE